MSFEKLICPECRYPLESSPSQSQVICPRCTKLLELEARCNGVCLSCHAVRKADQNGGTCVELSPQSQDCSQEKQVLESSCQEGNKGERSGIKALFKRLFHV